MSLQVIFSYNGTILAPAFFGGVFVLLLTISWLCRVWPLRSLWKLPEWSLAFLWSAHFLLIWYTTFKLTVFSREMSVELSRTAAKQELCILITNAMGLACCTSAMLIAITLLRRKENGVGPA